MSWDRAVSLTDLTYRYGPLLGAATIPATDTADGLGPVLDQVAALEAENATYVPNLLNIIARYLALDLICDRLAAKFDVAGDGDSYKLSQQFAAAVKLRDSLKAQVGWAVDVSGTSEGADDLGVGQVVTVSSPFLVEGYPTW